MLMMIDKMLFLLSAFLLAVMTVYGKLFVFKKKHPAFVSDYCATMAGILVVYVISALVLVWFLSPVNSKFIMFAFAMAPFLIGIIVNYHTEKYFTVLQVILFILSILFVI